MKKMILAVFVVVAAFMMMSIRPVAAEFDEYGYNDKARIFNGTGQSWCEAGGYDPAWCASYLGASANDKLVMKWTADWDRGNDEGWTSTYEHAWTSNEWNGNVEGGSGGVWHYKIHWIGTCGSDGTPTGSGGYCIWGQFDVLMDQGTFEGAHIWYTHATPTGYGAIDF